jgi:hypothetical protein
LQVVAVARDSMQAAAVVQVVIEMELPCQFQAIPL